MKLTLEGIQEKDLWQNSNISLPNYDVKQVRENTKTAPTWVHFGIGNIFRIFVGGIAETLLNNGDSDTGIICVETFDYDVIDKIYRPYDNLSLSVVLHGDGSMDKQVVGALAEAIAAKSDDAAAQARLKEIFTAPSLSMVSFTITEKGYSLHGSDGNYFPFVKADIENGPAHISCAMTLICSLLFERFNKGAFPISLVSMDNVSQNGKKLRESVTHIADCWAEKGFVPAAFVDYVKDESKVAFPWSMIDKITPRPAENVAKALADCGVEDMDPVITSRQTYIAPFVNAEAPQYLVIEDNFPNGRPALEKAGVYMTDRDTVNRSERMKVTVALNPLHKPLGFYGCLFGHALVSDAMQDTDLLRLVKDLGLREGMKVVEDPGIISPQAFIDEVINVRFPNPYIPDTPERLVVDSSQMMPAMFGETVKSYVAKFGSAAELVSLPLTLAGWFRYLLAVDDEGKSLTLQPDPLLAELTGHLKDITLGNPDSFSDQLKPILSNKNIFGVDLYQAGIGETIEGMFREMIAGTGAVRKTLQKYTAKCE